MFQKIKEQLNKFKKWIIALIIGGVALAAGISQLPQPEPIIEFDYPQGKLLKAWVRPTTDEGWMNDVIEESLNVKYD